MTDFPKQGEVRPAEIKLDPVIKEQRLDQVGERQVGTSLCNE
jgi:hypothetical protein